MNWEAVEQRLVDVFTTTTRNWRLDDEAGAIYARSDAFDLHEALIAALETDEEREEWSALEAEGFLYSGIDASSDAAVELVGQHWPIGDLIAFEWESLGPASAFATIKLLEIGSRPYVCWAGAGERLLVVAALEPKFGDGVQGRVFLLLASVFEDLVSSNGSLYGLMMFETLPSNTENYSPEILSAELVRHVYMEWMNWAERTEWPAWNWVSLAGYVAQRSIEPNSVARGLEAIQEAMDPARDRHASDEGEVTRESGQMPEPSRELILDLYLRRSYREYPGGWSAPG